MAYAFTAPPNLGWAVEAAAEVAAHRVVCAIANDDDPFLDSEMMKAMMRDLPEQELSVMVRGLVDPVLRGFAEEALAEIARRARTTWQKRIVREAPAKSRPRWKWTQ